MYNATFDRELFLEKLNKLNAFIPSKTVTPAFDNIRLSIGAGICEILASDGGVQVKLYSECKSKDTFVFCAPAKVFIATIALFRENEVKLSVKENKLQLKSGKSVYKMTLDTTGEDFPVMSLIGATNELTVHQFFLKKGLSSTRQFIDEKNPLPQLIGINLAHVDKRIIMTGAMQQVMCRFDFKPISINKWDAIMLPIETSKKTCTLLSDRGEVNIVHCIDKVCFSANTDSIDKFEVTSTLIDCKYPDTEAMFKKTPENQVIVNTGEFSDALKRLKLYTLEVPRIEMRINSSNKGELVVSATDDLTGKNGEETMTLANVTDKELKKSFNADFMLKALKEIEENTFNLHYDDKELVPARMYPVSTNTDFSFAFNVAGMLGE